MRIGLLAAKHDAAIFVFVIFIIPGLEMFGCLALFMVALLRPFALCPVKPLRLFWFSQLSGQLHGVPVADKRIKLLRHAVCSKV